MSLIEKINKERINKVISYSQNIPNPQTDELLENWAKKKEKLSKTFLKGEIIYTYPKIISFEISEEVKRERINDFISFAALLLSYQHPLVEFLTEISTYEFYNNSLEKPYTIYYATDEKKINAGAKVIRSFKHFIEDEKLLRDLQDKASEMIQENKVSGYLTFSIHPLDYLSSSENTLNWRSCHSLDGEYRAGNLSYMNDSSTIIVYLASDFGAMLPNFPSDVAWNSKKWRVLLHFDELCEVCFAGKQYPFYSENALDKVFEIFQENMVETYIAWGGDTKRYEWKGWYNDYIDESHRASGEDVRIEQFRYCIINNGIYDKNKIVHDVPDSRHFNDVLRSTCYDAPYYMFKRYWSPVMDINVEVGAKVKCLYCGEEYITTSDTMMCPDCECKYGNSESDDYSICDCCGRRFPSRDGRYVGIDEDEEFICPNCQDLETFTCEICGNLYYNSDIRYEGERGIYVCKHCKSEKEE